MLLHRNPICKYAPVLPSVNRDGPLEVLLKPPTSTVLITGSRTSPRIGSKHPETSASCSSCRSQGSGQTFENSEIRESNMQRVRTMQQHLYVQDCTSHQVSSLKPHRPMNAFSLCFRETARDCDHQESKSDHGLSKPSEGAGSDPSKTGSTRELRARNHKSASSQPWLVRGAKA